MTPVELDALYEDGTRKGALTLALTATVMLASTVVTPLVWCRRTTAQIASPPPVPPSRSSVVSSETFHDER